MAVLRADVFDRDEPLGNLLFPTPRMRSGVVEYRVEDFREELSERLTALQYLG